MTGYTWATRHALVKKTFMKILREYGFNPDPHEPRFKDGKGADVLFQIEDTIVIVDVTIVNPLADSYVEAEALTPGSCLAAADGRKDRVHGGEAEVRRMEFYPMALSIFGELSKRSKDLLTRCAKCVTDGKGFQRHMMSALAVAVQKGNASILVAAMKGLRERGVR